MKTVSISGLFWGALMAQWGLLVARVSAFASLHRSVFLDEQRRTDFIRNVTRVLANPVSRESDEALRRALVDGLEGMYLTAPYPEMLAELFVIREELQAPYDA